MMNALFTTVKSLASPLKGLLSVYSQPKLLVIGATYAAVKAYFTEGLNISPQLTFGLIELVIIDTILGIWKHIKRRTVSSTGFGNFATKVIIYWLFIRAAEQLAKIKVAEVASLSWTGDLLISGLLIREGISILENMEAIRPGIVPGWITKRLQDIDDDGELNQSKTKTDA